MAGNRSEIGLLGTLSIQTGVFALIAVPLARDWLAYFLLIGANLMGWVALMVILLKMRGGI